MVGYDANALYLWAIGQDMPEGVFARRRADNNFRPEFRDRYMQAFNWLNYLNRYDGKHISHARNNGKEVKIGKYPVDGFDSTTNTVYQFHVSLHSTAFFIFYLFFFIFLFYFLLIQYPPLLDFKFHFRVFYRDVTTMGTIVTSPKMSRTRSGKNVERISSKRPRKRPPT